MQDSPTRETMGSYLTRSAKAYLEGQNDWLWIVSTINQSGLNKQQTRQLILPLRDYRGKFRAQVLFSWLETR